MCLTGPFPHLIEVSKYANLLDRLIVLFVYFVNLLMIQDKLSITHLWPIGPSGCNHFIYLSYKLISLVSLW